MLRLDNTAEGGTAGQVIDANNTAGLSGDAFQHFQDAGTQIRFATAAAVHGSLGYEFVGAVSASCYLQWLGDDEPSYAIRGYLRAASLPPVAASASMPFAQVRTAAGTAASLSVTGDGRFRILNAPGTTAANGTAVMSGIALGVGHRFEGRITPGTTTANGTAELRVYLGDVAVNTTPFETLTATGDFRTTAPTHVRFGRVTPASVTWDFWLDDLALQTGSAGFIGPFATPNVTPVVNAGQDQAVDTGQAVVTLTGTDSDPDGTITTRTWTQDSGPTVLLTGTGATRTFPRPMPLDGDTLGFTYTVTDNRGQQASDSVTTYLLPVTERAVIGGVEVPMQMMDVRGGAAAITPLLTDTMEGTGNFAGSTSTTGDFIWWQRLARDGVTGTTTNNVTRSGGTIGARAASNPGVDVWFSTDTQVPDHSVQVTLAALGTTAATRHGGPGVRIGDDGTGIFLSLRQSGTVDGYSIRRVDRGGAISTLATTTRVPVVGERLRIEAQGEVITAYVDGSQIMQVNDSLNALSGEVGILFGSTTSGFPQRWDDLTVLGLAAPVVDIPNVAPAAGFTTTVTALHVVADATDSPDPDGAVMFYAWDWADGTTSTVTTPIVEHDYTTAGTYPVSLTVTDDDGATSTVQRDVTVVAPAPAPTTVAAEDFPGTGNLPGSTTTTGGLVWRQQIASSGASSTTANNVTKTGGTAGARASSSPGVPIWSSFDGVANGEVKAALTAVGADAATRGGGLGARIATDGSGVALMLRQSATVDGYSLTRVNPGGTLTNLVTTTRVPLAGDRLRLAFDGTTLTAYVASGVAADVEDVPASAWQMVATATEPINATIVGGVGLYHSATTSGFAQRWARLRLTAAAGAPVTTPLTAPVLTGGPGASGEVALDWNDVAGATGYQVRNAAGTVLASPVASGVTLTGLTNGTAYPLTVRATGPGGAVGPVSNTVTVTPAAATSLTSMAGYAADFDATGLAAGPVTTWTEPVRGLAVTQATATRRPVRGTVDGRAAVTFGPNQVTNADGTTTTAKSFLASGASALSQGKAGLTVYTLAWIPEATIDETTIVAMFKGGDQRFAARLMRRRPMIAGKRLDTGGGTLWMKTPGVTDITGSWHFIGYHHLSTGQVRITVDGVLDHTSNLHTAGAFANTALTALTIGGTTTTGELEGSVGRLLVFEGVDTTVAHAQQVMAAIGFTPPTPPPTTFTFTVGPDMGTHYQTGVAVVRDEYRALITLSESATYEARSSLNLRQVWRFTGAKFRVPFMDPGQHTFQVRRLDPSTGKWSAWKIAAAPYSARPWPTVPDDNQTLMWRMPNAWGKTYPITTITLTPGQGSLTLNADGHYLIKTPAGVRFETNRFDLNIGTAPTDEVLFKIEGGEFHSAPDARINLKHYTANSVAWIYGQMEGIAFTGGNNGDTVQMSWNGVTDGTLVTQNCSGAQITWGRVEHSDTHQLYAGPNTWKCDRWDAASDYQGFILYPQQINGFLDRNGGYITSWPMHRTRVHIGTRLNKEGTSHTAGIPYYSWHDLLTGAPWFVYDKTPGSIHGLFSTQDTDAMAPPTYAQTMDPVTGQPVAGSVPIGTKIGKTPGANIGCWYIDPANHSLAGGNVSPGPWDGVTRIAKGGTLPGAINLTGTGKIPGIGYNPTLVTYAATPAAP